MSNNYKHAPEEMLASANKLTGLIQEYNEKVSEIKALVETINSSPDWQDAELKASFNDTCNSYIKIYQDVALKCAYNVDKLKAKAKSASEFEQAYARGGE